jgi:aldose 1-epimerase
MQTNYQWLKILSTSLGAAALVGCAGISDAPAQKGQINQRPFGQMKDGTPVTLFTLRNNKGAEAGIINYGGLVIFLKVPDRNGHFDDVVLGYNNLADYIKDSPYFGAMIGRYGNRIGKAKFTLDGVAYTLAPNNNGNTLHGGRKGFDKVVWTGKEGKDPSGPSVELTYLSKDGEEGYPGNLNVKAVYTLSEDNALQLQFTATTDKPTIVNLTQHSYFNLAGKGDILGHDVYINSDKMTPVDAGLIPTGELKSVEGTPFDFRKATAIGARIDQPDDQLKLGPGYDHNWIINKPAGQLGLMARVTDPVTGRVLEVWSTEPALQFYSGNFLDGTIHGKGQAYERHGGFAMEPQHYPDSPNHPDFPSTTLRPGETYSNTIIYKFPAK